MNGDAGLKITVTKAPGEKCERCWNYSTHVGEDKEYPTVCERCSAVLPEMDEKALFALGFSLLTNPQR